MNKKKYFFEVFEKAERKFGGVEKRLAGEGWSEGWQTLIATIMSAQSRDETTIPIAEALFRRYGSLEKLADARYNDVVRIFRSLNYNKTKAKNVIACARMLVDRFGGKLPMAIEELVELPGVGRKTANLVIAEVHDGDGICIDTHVHRISNVLGLVKTKNPTETEFALMKIAPRTYWSRINRLFVLWGKSVGGRDRKKLLAALE
ncbi:MAG TPA: endonuclease III [Candidatus Nanoarchaeia archaeon]|nr:endonuclease III [Candidatus Nanoarchaeia archaeon]